jgi:hypothetical protein
MNRILIGALSGWKYPDRRQRCATTWFPRAHKFGCDAVFLVGIPGIPAPERDCNFLLLPCPDAYDNLPQRTLWFCRWALMQQDWDYLFKCDDDTYVCAERLASYDTQGRAYIGAEWEPGVGYGSGGAGYFMSRQAAAIVAERLTMLTGSEDLLVGQVLREAGVPFSIEPRLVPYGSDAKRPKADNDLLTLHGVGADLFLASHSETAG